VPGRLAASWLLTGCDLFSWNIAIVSIITNDAVAMPRIGTGGT
jgi:hypothetical protein